jgi:hypothetical protein
VDVTKETFTPKLIFGLKQSFLRDWCIFDSIIKHSWMQEKAKRIQITRKTIIRLWLKLL